MKPLLQKPQSGFALLIFVVVLMGFGGTIAASFLGSKVESVNQNKDNHDYEVLRKAKQALLSFAVDYTVDNDFYEMGRLPCPDATFTAITEGIQSGNCGARHANAVGYLPWKTLGMEVLRDSNGECLWYVVSGDYKGSPKADMLNEDSNGLLWIQDENGIPYHGVTPGDRPIAIIIAPGGQLQGQTRNLADNNMAHCRGNYTEANYLESGGIVNYATDHLNSADDIWTYLHGSLGSRLDNSNFNDKMVWISKDEYWDAVKAQKDLEVTPPGSAIDQLTEAIAECLLDYAEDSNNENYWLPWPANINLVEYRNDEINGGANEYIDSLNPASLIGRVPQNISFSDAAEFGLPGASQINTAAANSNIFAACLSGNENELWQNWKDHFFYVVSRDFEMLDGSPILPISGRCVAPGDCVTIDGLVGEKIAAIVFFSGSAITGQSRNSTPVDADEKDNLGNYLDVVSPTKSNAHLYPTDAVYFGAGGDVNKYYDEVDINTQDLAYCLVVDGSGTDLEVTDCT